MTLRADSTERGKNLDEVFSINLVAQNGWQIYIFEDGSAKVQYGSGPLDNAKAPPGTVNFVELRRAIEAQLQASSGHKAPVSAAICPPGQVSVTARPLASTDVWNNLAAKLNGKLTSMAQRRFDSLLEKVPLAITK